MKVAVYVKRENAVRAGNDEYGWQTVDISAENLSDVADVVESLDDAPVGSIEDYRVPRYPRVCGEKLPCYSEGNATSRKVLSYLYSLQESWGKVIEETRDDIRENPDDYIEVLRDRMRPKGLSKVVEMEELVQGRIDRLIDQYSGEASYAVLDAVENGDYNILVKSAGGRIMGPEDADDVAPIDYWTVETDEMNIKVPRGRLHGGARAAIEIAVEETERHLHRIEKKREQWEREKEQEQACYENERRRWAEEHGSRRLRQMIEEGIECDAVYRDERLAVERPGWVWEDNVRGNPDEPRNVPDEAFDILYEARSLEPDATLWYWTVERNQDEYYGDPYEDSRFVWTGYVARARFIGEPILHGYDGP